MWWIPRSLDARALAAATPKIEPVPGDAPRPFWSVMIPHYNCTGYLQQTLSSVLEQDLGPERMQIEVIDDASTDPGVKALVQELGKGRVSLYRHDVNVGVTRTFNTCLRRSKGHWVHILHADDYVLPGFYDTYEKLIQRHPDAMMVLGPVAYVDESGKEVGRGGPEPTATGMIEDFVARQAVQQLGQFAGIVVRRAAYEQVGGFCEALSHTADWDMWFRVGLLGKVLCPDRAYAAYRLHSGADTCRQRITGNNVRETVIVICANHERLGRALTVRSSRNWRHRLADAALCNAWALDKNGQWIGRKNQAVWAFLLSPSLKTGVFACKSWAKSVLKQVVTRS